ncbi:MAG TPA: hypothetical protein VMZ05_00185 [Spirochaetota bacterium]|nr:hypothetical protein [Spirochaetota bacterium]
MEPAIQHVEDISPGEALVALAEFVTDRKEAILAGAYEIEIADIDEGSFMKLVSFGISIRQGVRFKFNIDLARG